MSDAATVDFLASVPLLDGLPHGDLAELAGAMRRRELPAGTVLWREGEPARSMVLIVDGEVSVTLHLPGDRTVEVARMARGEVLGEIPLVDGGRHTASATVAEPATVLALSRSDFAALVARRHPTAFALKRSLARIASARLRRQFANLATTLGDEPAKDDTAPAGLEFCGPPNSRYVRRLANLRAFDSLALWGVLTAGRYAQCSRGRTLVAEGRPSTAFYMTMNGAVEKVIARGGRRIRVGLAGPGLAFGYESLIDGGPSPVTAATRERTLLLVVPPQAFARLFEGEEAESHVFLDVLLRDAMAALRQALRPQARLATSVPSRPAWAADPREPPSRRGTPPRTP